MIYKHFDQFIQLFWNFVLLPRSIITVIIDKKNLGGIILLFVNISLLFFPFLTPPVEEPPPMEIPIFRYFPEKPRVTYFSQDCNTTFTLSWDDARPYDVKLAPIDQKYGISHTIFAPSYRSYPNKSYWRYAFLIDELFQGYDVQSHCGKHVHLSQYTKEEQEFYVKWGRTGIEDLFGFTPIVFAYPYGDCGGSTYVKQYFELGRTIGAGGTSWPPSSWALEGATISGSGIDDSNLNKIEPILKGIYHSEGYQVFKGYGHTNSLGKTYGVTDFIKYEQTIKNIAGWPDVWYTSWGELAAYEIEKQFVEFSTIDYYEDRLEFKFSTPNLDVDIFKVPITIGILIPKTWNNPIPQIGNKFSSQFSIREYNDSKEMLLQVLPSQSDQPIFIWRDLNFSDETSPLITNVNINTRFIMQDWDQDSPQLYYYTFLRFEVEDSLSDVLNVNASVHLKNGKILHFPVIKNPIFWSNATFGRVIWDSNKINEDVTQITASEIAYLTIWAQDGFGNLIQQDLYSDGRVKKTNIVTSQGNLHRFDDKPYSQTNRLPEINSN